MSLLLGGEPLEEAIGRGMGRGLKGGSRGASHVSIIFISKRVL